MKGIKTKTSVGKVRAVKEPGADEGLPPWRNRILGAAPDAAKPDWFNR